MNNSSDVNDSGCHYFAEEFLPAKFILVGIFGSGLAMVSIIANSFLFYTFIRSKKLFRTHLFYLGVLAVMDAITALCYIFIIAAFIYNERFDLVYLRMWYYSYLKIGFTLTHVALGSSLYLLIAATFERLHVNLELNLCRFNIYRRCIALCAAVFLSLLVKGGIYFEFNVEVKENCPMKSRYDVRATKLVTHSYVYGTVYRFYVRNIFAVFLPFIILAVANFAIVLSLRNKKRKARKESAITGNKIIAHTKERVTAAAKLFMMIISTYLAANSLSFFITAWEQIDIMSLYTTYAVFYTFAADCTSILTLIVTILRLPTYYVLNVDIRCEIEKMLRQQYNTRAIRT